MKQRFVVVAAITALCTAFAGEAAAQNSGEYPVRLVSRPQTIPQRTLRLDGQFAAAHFSACTTIGLSSFCASATATNLNLGGGFGLTNEFEIGATVAPLQLTESFEYNNPSLYGRYQFYNVNGIQASGQLTAWIPVRSGSDFALNAALPVWVNFTDQFQLQTGLSYSLTVSDPISHSLAIPLLFNLNVTDEIHLALRTGVNLPFKDTGDTISVPLGIEAGYALRGPNNRPMLDVLAQFSFPSFLVPGSSGDVLFTDLWTTGITGRFYLFM